MFQTNAFSLQSAVLSFKRSIRARLFPSLCPPFRLFDEKDPFDFSGVAGSDTGQYSTSVSTYLVPAAWDACLHEIGWFCNPVSARNQTLLHILYSGYNLLQRCTKKVCFSSFVWLFFFSFHSCISVIILMNSCNLSAGLHLCIFGSAFSGKQVPFAKGSRRQLRRNNFSDEGFNFIAQICKCTNNIDRTLLMFHKVDVTRFAFIELWIIY